MKTMLAAAILVSVLAGASALGHDITLWPDQDGKLIKLKFGSLVQLLAFARQIRPFGVGLRTDGHIFAGGHRHRASHQSRDTRD